MPHIAPPRRPRPVSAPRRRLLLGAPALLAGLAAPSLAQALAPTPRQGEGPFYPRRLPEDRDWDLTLFRGETAPGAVMEMIGRVFTVSGAPAAGAEVEIWHCDPSGVYAHVGLPAAPNFQGYGAVRAAADGAYRFRTTLPGLYGSRPRHIHVKARDRSGRRLTTQMYFPGEADALGVMGWGPPAPLIAGREIGPPPRYRFDIVLPG